MNGTYLRLDSRHLGRKVHLWQFGHAGRPVVAFPTASGMAHEWQASGAIDTLRPLLEAGRIRLFCPESNVAEAWTRDGDPAWKLTRHQAYEAFVTRELLPYIRQQVGSPRIRLAAAGASFGAYYALNMALKYPEVFHWSLCLSGRYAADKFLNGYAHPDTWFVHPMAYVPGLHGQALDRVRRHTSLTLVVGQGNFEGSCIPETHDMAKTLQSKGIRVEHDVWGHDVSHEWVWWKRQLAYHFARRF